MVMTIATAALVLGVVALVVGGVALIKTRKVPLVKVRGVTRSKP